MREKFADSKKRKNVIELIRVPAEGQDGPNRVSIAAQKASNRRTAKKFGLKIIRTVEISDATVHPGTTGF
jgi:hypothetical protein